MLATSFCRPFDSWQVVAALVVSISVYTRVLLTLTVSSQSAMLMFFFLIVQLNTNRKRLICKIFDIKTHTYPVFHIYQNNTNKYTSSTANFYKYHDHKYSKQAKSKNNQVTELKGKRDLITCTFVHLKLLNIIALYFFLE